MDYRKFLRVALVASAAALTVAACDSRTQAQADREGAAIGQKSDAALATAKEKLKEAGREAGQKLSEAGVRTQQTLEHGAQKLGVSGNGDTSTTSGGTGAGTAREKHSSADDDVRWGDAAITASIKADYLKDPDLSVFKIDVDTKDGVVTLNGLAQDDAARTRAQRLAEGIKGVREVHNHLVIKQA